MNDEQWREWIDRHDREHENPLEFPDCEQCLIILADRRYIAEQAMKAALVEEPRTLRREHYCGQYMGFNSDCADPAYDTVDGDWFCDRHAHALRETIKWSIEYDARYPEEVEA